MHLKEDQRKKAAQLVLRSWDAAQQEIKDSLLTPSGIVGHYIIRCISLWKDHVFNISEQYAHLFTGTLQDDTSLTKT